MIKSSEKIMKKKTFIKAEMDTVLGSEESDILWEQSSKRLAEIIKKYETLSDGVHAHTDNFIFPSAAVYLTIKEHAGEDIAYKIIENSAIKASGDAGKKLAILMRVPGMKSLFIKVWDPLTKKKFGSNSGFKNVFYDNPKGEYKMDIVACPYCKYFTELGCPEITKVFCANDNRVYGNLPGIEFRRNGTLGTGAERCDFYIRKV